MSWPDGERKTVMPATLCPCPKSQAQILNSNPWTKRSFVSTKNMELMGCKDCMPQTFWHVDCRTLRFIWRRTRSHEPCRHGFYTRPVSGNASWLELPWTLHPKSSTLKPKPQLQGSSLELALPLVNWFSRYTHKPHVLLSAMDSWLLRPSGTQPTGTCNANHRMPILRV